MSERIAVVTGAGSGIGRASALGLCRQGWTVISVGRNIGSLEETANLSEDSGRILPHVCDVSRPEEVDALFAALEERWRRLDLLFNNAGIFPKGSLIDELSVEAWNEAVGVNLTGSFLCARAAFARMRRQNPMGGRIINNGSLAAYAPRPRSVAYTATKHAITGLTKSLALDGRPFNIACGQIDIGNAATAMAASMTQGMPQADGHVAAEPVLDLDHVAAAVVQMAELPLEANILFMTVMATNMPFVGRG